MTNNTSAGQRGAANYAKLKGAARTKALRGATLTCAKCGSRNRRDTARSPCPICGAKASAGDV